MPERLIRIFYFLLSRTAVLIIVLVGIFYGVIDHKRVERHALPTTLSRLRPSYVYIAGFADGKLPFDKRSFDDQRIYLENVRALMGDMPDATALLAYCQYYLGQKKTSEALFLKSLQSNPVYFWSYYDLAVMAFKAGDMKKTADFLRSAVQLNPELTLKFIMTSRVFLPLINDARYTPEKFFFNFQSGMLNAYKMLVMADFSSGNFPDALRYAEVGLQLSREDNDRAVFLYFIGTTALRLGNIQVAVKNLEMSLALSPDNPEALADMAVVLKATGQETVSAEFAQKAHDISLKKGSRLPKPDDFKLRVF